MIRHRVIGACSLLLAFLLALPVGVQAQTGAQIRVDDPATLAAALMTARGGETVMLGGGDYGVLKLTPHSGVPGRYAHPVTITSADPANPARFSGMGLLNAENVVFDGVVFDYSYGLGDQHFSRPFIIAQSRGITIRNAVFDGDLAQGMSELDDGFGMATGLAIREAQDITLENSEFFTFYRALDIGGSRNVVVRGNDIHSIRCDGMNLAQVEDVLIEGNHLHDFQVSAQSGDHRDMIQFWTAATKKPTQRVVIRNNVLNAGGGLYTQSIFMRNERVDTKEAGLELYYRDIRIMQNVIINAHLHGITVGETIGLEIANNTLIRSRLSQTADDGSVVWIPAINIKPESRDVAVTDNMAGAITTPDAGSNWRMTGNLVIQDDSPAAPGWYDDIFVAARSGDPAQLASFAYLAEGVAGGGGLGASALHADQIMATLDMLDRTGPAMGLASAARQGDRTMAIIRATVDPARITRVSLDAGASLLPAGSGAPQARWDAGGGVVAEGMQASLDLPGPGPHDVTLTLTLPSGDVLESTTRINVPWTEIIRLSPQTGAVLLRQGPDMLPVKDIALSSAGTVILAPETPSVGLPRATGTGGAAVYDLDLRLRFRINGPTPAGEILRLHPVMMLSLTPTGGVGLRIIPQDGPAVQFSTGPLRLHDGKWHDLQLVYDATAGKIMIAVDGKPRVTRAAGGPLAPAASWAVSLGSPFDGRPLHGEIAALALLANAGGMQE